MGITAAISLPAIHSTLTENRLKGAAYEVVTALEYAQLTAMSSGRGTRVVIVENQERIGVRQYTSNADFFTGGDELAENDVENGSYVLMPYPTKKGINYPILLTDENRFSGVDITVSDFNAGSQVDFNAQGAPTKGGSVTLALGGEQIVVTLDALTGKVTVN
ncbi:response regulator [Candidatus Scalindua japonica]|uniref:Response regulator n=2 Tax=Candidatus Scalindua japonica TaxID=1284222 RepID=A0A286TTM1_9BACT|nr:response regulator [Candidatus Scalindua japonica]